MHVSIFTIKSLLAHGGTNTLFIVTNTSNGPTDIAPTTVLILLLPLPLLSLLLLLLLLLLTLFLLPELLPLSLIYLHHYYCSLIASIIITNTIIAAIIVPSTCNTIFTIFTIPTFYTC